MYIILGPGFSSLLLRLIPGDLYSTYPHSQLHTLPGLFLLSLWPCIDTDDELIWADLCISVILCRFVSAKINKLCFTYMDLHQSGEYRGESTYVFLFMHDDNTYRQSFNNLIMHIEHDTKFGKEMCVYVCIVLCIAALKELCISVYHVYMKL